jgi:hypothetical protein
VGAAAGLVAVALLIVGFFLPGTPPKANDSAVKITHYLIDKRGSLLAAQLIIGLGLAFFVFWLGALRSHLRGPTDDGGAAVAAVAGGLIGAALTLAGSAVVAATVFKVAKVGDLTLNRALFDTFGALFAISGFGFAVLIGAASASGARSGALPGWLIGTGFGIAVLQLVGTLALVSTSGFFAAGEAFGFIVFLVGVAWIVATSVVMLRTEPAAAPPG